MALPRSSLDTATLTKGLLIAAAIAVGLLLAWALSDVLLLVFAAAILATVLRAGSDVMERFTPIRGQWAIRLTIVLFFLAIGGFIYLFGTQLWSELQELSKSLPEKIDTLGGEIGVPDLWDQLSKISAAFPNNWLVTNLPAYASGMVQVIGSVLVVVSAGIYLALDPAVYRKGALLLVPAASRERVGLALDTAGYALRLWMLGQLATMAMVGVAIGIGLYFIGLPSALALGLIAATLEFIPFIGPIMSAVPALILAMTRDFDTLLWVLGLFIVVQQAENNLIVPLIQKRTVELPPALGIVAVIGFGLLFGWLGLFFGTPLTVVVMVLIKYLYVREIENEDVSVAGLEQAEAAERAQEVEPVRVEPPPKRRHRRPRAPRNQ